MTTTIPSVLDRNGVIAYVGQNAAQYGLDPAAVLAVANHEGLNTSPGSSWKIPGETNISFGPPSWYGNGAGATILQQHGENAPAWSWTPAGIDYWLQSVAQSARGLSGASAIRAIVTGFERPRADLVQGEINNSTHDYNAMQAAIAATTGTAPTTTNPPALDGGFNPSPGVIGAINVGGISPQSTGTQLAQVGPFPINVPSGLVIGLIGVLILILGALLFAFNMEFRQQTIKVSPAGIST